MPYLFLHQYTTDPTGSLTPREPDWFFCSMLVSSWSPSFWLSPPLLGWQSKQHIPVQHSSEPHTADAWVRDDDVSFAKWGEWLSQWQYEREHTKSLYFRCLCIWFLLRVLRLHFSSNDKLSNIIFFWQSKEFANLACSLGTKTFGVSNVGESRKIGISLFNDYDGKDWEIWTNDAASYGFTFAFAGTTGTIAGVTFGEEETDTSWMEDTLNKLELVKVMEMERTFFMGKPCLSFPPVTLNT